METMLELYDTKEMPHGMFPLSFNIIYHYEREELILTEKIIEHNIKRVIFHGRWNTISLVTYGYKILQQLQR